MITDLSAELSLVFRSNEDGSSSYLFKLVPTEGLIQLTDVKGEEGLLQERRVSLVKDHIYHLRVKAEGSRLQVFWGSRYEPIIDVQERDLCVRISGSAGPKRLRAIPERNS